MKNEGLERFVKAQEYDFALALREIKNGRKESHWMWYIFPQIEGLGHSPTAQYYAVKDRKEAEDYMGHPLLGSRLLEISGELLKLKSGDAREVLGWPDDMKLKSSMTLFEAVSGEKVFAQVLEKFFGGERDAYTLEKLGIERKNMDCGMSFGYTLEDYFALPDDVRVELIDGQFFEMRAPSLRHQAFCMEVSIPIRNFIQKKKGGCVVFAAPVDVQLDLDDRTVVQPDIAVVCGREKLNKDRIMGAPDFIIEVLSPSTKGKDMFLKLMKYRNAGVREYWMIDIEKERIITYYFEEDDIPVIYGMDSIVPVKIFEGEISIDFSEVTKAVQGIGMGDF